MSGDVAETSDDAPIPASAPAGDQIAALEELAQEFSREIADLRAQLASFRKQFE